MSITRLNQLVTLPQKRAAAAKALSESFGVPVRIESAHLCGADYTVFAVPFSALRSTGLQVVESIAPDTKALIGKSEAVTNAQNRVSKVVQEKVTLVGLNADTSDILFTVTSDYRK